MRSGGSDRKASLRHHYSVWVDEVTCSGIQTVFLMEMSLSLVFNLEPTPESASSLLTCSWLGAGPRGWDSAVCSGI